MAASGAGFLLLTLFIWFTVEREAQAIAAAQHRTIAREVAADAGRHVAMALEALTELSNRLPRDRLGDANAMEAMIRADGALFSIFNDVVVLGADGIVVADWPLLAGRRGRDNSAAKHFRDASATGTPQISRPFRGPISGTPTVTLIVPVAGADGRTAALLSGLLRLNRPNALGALAKRKLGVSGYFQLVDGDGTVLIHPDPQRVMTPVTPHGGAAAIAKLRGGEGLHEKDGRLIYAAAAVPGTDWTLLAVLPKAEAYQSLASMRWTLAGIFALLLVATGMLIRPLVGRLLAPLDALSAATRAVADSNDPAARFDLSPVPRGTTEVDALAAALGDAMERTRRASDELAQSNARLGNLIESLFGFIGVCSLDGRLLDANEAPFRATGVTREEAIGRLFWDTFWWDYSLEMQDRVRNALRRAAQGEVTRLELCARLKDGSFINIDSQFGPLRNATGEIVELIGFGVDVTERVRAEAALRHSERHVRALFDSLPISIGYADREERITFSNRAYRDSYSGGVDPAGRTIREAVGDEIYAVVAPRIRQTLRGEMVSFERAFRHADGSAGVRALRYLPDLNENGQIAGFFAVIEDITERRRAEEQLRTALSEKEVLLKEIYHRVKNNLQVVASLLNMQERGVADADMRALLAESANRVKSMALVHEQLYRSHDLSNIVLGEYLKQLAEHLEQAHRPLSARVPVRLLIEPLRLGIETAVPLGLIVNELVSNAYKHGYAAEAPRGEIVLEARALEDGRVRVAVTDDGRGLPAGFDPRAASTLGMQLVVTLAAQLGGELTLESRPGATAFCLAFRPEEREARRLAA